MRAAARCRMPAQRRTIMRRRTVALAVLTALVAITLLALLNREGSPRQSDSPAFVTLRLDGRALARRRLAELRRPAGIGALLATVPVVRTIHRGATEILVRTERLTLHREIVEAVRRSGGTVAIPEHATAARTRVPLVQQALRDNCEAAALSMILAFRGRAVGQLALQREVAHSRPLDPTVSTAGAQVWGDPNLGFVGRADGGGPAGGYGVYQGPIKALAQRHGLRLRDLTGSSAGAVYRSLLAGHPVLAWVALAEGPYATWQTPAGRTIRANYGEHAIVLTGVGPDTVSLNDPLSGRRLTWTKGNFERMWAALGARALSA